MKNILSTSIFLILTSTLSSQDLFKQNEAKNYEINLSTGLNYISYIGEAFLTRGLEVRGKVWKKFEIGFDLKYGQGLDKSNFREFIFNSNANIYLNLTPSSQIHDFCFGLSASYMYYQEPAQEYNYQSTEYGSRSYTSLGSAHDQLLGAGLILDYKITLKEYLTIGVKSFIYGYPTQALYGGLMFTSGVRF